MNGRSLLTNYSIKSVNLLLFMVFSVCRHEGPVVPAEGGGGGAREVRDAREPRAALVPRVRQLPVCALDTRRPHPRQPEPARAHHAAAGRHQALDQPHHRQRRHVSRQTPSKNILCLPKIFDPFQKNICWTFRHPDT